MNRRGFLLGCLAAAAAPAIVRADSLMRVIPRDLVVFPRCTEMTGTFLQFLREQESAIRDTYTVFVHPEGRIVGLDDPAGRALWVDLLHGDARLFTGSLGKWG